MINTIDLFLGITILLVGFSYWTITLVEHNQNYYSVVKEDYKLTKAINTMKYLAENGILDNTVLLYYLNKDMAKNYLEKNINLSNYMVVIDGNVLINHSYNGGNTYVIAIVTLNKTEGWYVIYGNDNLKISEDRYLSFEEAYNSYKTYKTDMPVYLVRNISSSRVELYVG